MPSPHLLRQLGHAPQIRSQEAGPDAPDLDPILLQLVVPVQHQHVERRLAAAVANRVEVHLLGPPGRLRRRGEVGLACLREVRETGDEDQAGVGRLEQERHEGPGHDVCAGDVHVVGSREAVAEGSFAGEEFEIEGGPLWMSVRVECHGI